MATIETTKTVTALGTKQKPKRRIFGWRACAPIIAMIRNEERSSHSKTNIIEEGLAKAYGAKYPKLLARYRTISKSKAA